MGVMKELEFKQEHLQILSEYHIDVTNIINPQLRGFNPGEWLCEDGERMSHIFFLVSGTVRTLIPAKERNGLVIGQYMNRGVFDDTMLMRDETVSHIRAVAETNVTVIALPIMNKEILLSQPQFVLYLARGYAMFIDETMNSFYFKKYPMETLLCSYIAIKRTDLEWIPDWNQCASDLNSTPRALERCVKMLMNKGILKRGEQGYMIADVILFEEYNKGLFTPDGRRKRI